jgi:branched-chain amino acid aminotransferase
MSHLLFQDGQFYRDDKLIVGAGSRGLRYGDGVFETMKVNHDRIQLGNYHMERLFAGLKLLEFECPANFTPDYLLDKILQLSHRNGHSLLARIRLMIHRGNGSLHDPENHYPHHIIQCWSLPAANHEWNVNGLVLGVHRKAKKSMDVLANSKTNNYLGYILAALEAKHQRWNDAIMLNSADRICDSTIANIFLIRDGIIITPKLEEGPVSGIMRRYLIENFITAGIKVEEQAVTEELISDAQEVFLTNSSFGIRWVRTIGNKEYDSEQCRSLYNQFIVPLFGI